MKRKEVETTKKCDKVFYVKGFVIFMFLLVFSNQLRVQVFNRQEIIDKARNVHRLTATQVIEATRGQILSSDGKILACATEDYVFGVNPKTCPFSPALFSEISGITGISASELLDVVSRGKDGIEWDLKITRENVKAIKNIKTKYFADGIWVRPTGEREYPLGKHASGVIGFMKDGEGRAGIEKTYDEFLKGKNGKKEGMTDKHGAILPWFIVNEEQQSEDGKDIVLTIDADIQRVASTSLNTYCLENKASHGVAIVMNPKNGDILALANYPAFDPTRPERELADAVVGKRSTPELNPAVGLRFEPGSTFKIFTVALGLETGVINANSSVACNGQKQFSVANIRCSGDAGIKSHGSVAPRKCIEVSCNIAAATWAVNIGFEKYSKFIERLELLEPSGIGIHPEVPGQLNYNDWNKTIQMANIGFGQSINATPLNLTAAYAVFANEGRLVRPRLVKKIGEDEIPVKPQKQIIQPETAHKVMDMMKYVIESESGTGRTLRIPGYLLAGKTGTAQKRDEKTGSMRSGRYVSSFIGYTPADSPKAVIFVMVDNPTAGKYYGAVVAGPVFREISEYLLRRWQVPPSRN